MKGPHGYDTKTYREEHTRCSACHFDGSTFNPLELHHLSGRSGKRACDHRNYLMLCRDCHSCFHHVSAGSQQLDLGHILWIKRDEDGEGGEAGLDLAFLASVRNRKALKEDPTEPPQWVWDARRDNGTGWWNQH